MRAWAFAAWVYLFAVLCGVEAGIFIGIAGVEYGVIGGAAVAELATVFVLVPNMRRTYARQNRLYRRDP